MMNQNKQSGKGLAGFFVGLLLATAVIAGVLFFLNKSNKTAIKTASQPQVRQEAEILVPGSGSSISHETASQASSTVVVDTAPQASSTAVSKDGGSASIPSTVPTETTSQPASDHTATSEAGAAVPLEEEPVAIPGKVKTEQQIKAEQIRQQQLKKQAEAERLAKLKKQAEAKKKLEAQKREDTKPSPEQILNSGNVDKARQQANKEEAERKKAEAALSGRAGQSQESKAKIDKQSAATKKSGKVVIQVGSYGNKQAADAQRAKLAMMGVSAQVVEGQAGDKSVYRVQTGELDSEAAASVRKKLQQNGVQSLTRSVQ
ncbi:MAG: SPOR domain-containing protein [Neisseria sp.]|uniref:SPOR domain-containing protein n=1 Tax=Neisseria sp. TaxID=192066 RepID=UPI0026DBA279|nr:SPOR domain-containing protein [Neisseria sp.]MDO4249091.1 SPOR domain-containing protein [Neisseria sp.]